MVTSDILEKAKQLQQDLVHYRRILHQMPEVGLDLPKTSAFVMEQLKGFGYEPQRIGTSGILVVIEGAKEGRTVMLRADMDALPIEEQSGEPFSSKNGNMHACGHDMHTAMLLGAAKLLKPYEGKLNGTIKLLFQPGEEIFRGAKEMIDNGVLDNPKVDFAMMLHVATGMPLPHGFFSKAVEGPFTATSDTFRIKVIGKGGHGAAPELTTDPLLPLAHILTSLETIRTRGISAFDPVVLTVGQVHGGAAANVIASEAFMEGTFRTFKKQNREKIKERIRQIAENISEAYGAKSEVKFFNGCPSVVIDRRAAELFNQTISSLLGSQALIPFDQILPGGKIMGSEDFGFYTEYVPSVMSFITAGDSRKGYIYPPHHPKVRFSEEPLYIGAAAYAAFALNVLA